MANNSISWLGNPVVDGNSSDTLADSSTFYQASISQDSQAEFPNEIQSEISVNSPYQQCPNQKGFPYQQGPMYQQGPTYRQGPPVQQGSSDQQGPDQQGPPPVADVGYVPYYLASNIGKNVRAEFAISGALYVDKTGKLIEVGVNYFVLEDINSRANIMCDLYSVKFVTILQ
jgi:hypothetical protein